MSAPSAEERRTCWGARDAFWRCLDDNQEDRERCAQLQKQFESSCPAQWVKYFHKRRDFLKYKEKLLTDGYEPVGQSAES
ncbi:cytochrome c oxidase assembly factor 6 homolog [Lepisosteus oculatus]|uniref:cytochrome c oxidase assembly factor 6 homolog n=1 Tax=Lepisosteus oculatus TaxID=7918 RepID=UPI00371F6012